MNESQTQSQTDTTSTDDASFKDYQSTLPGVLGTLDNLISKIEAIVLAAGVLLMAANTIANVVGRFVFQNSIFFSEELNRILIIMITFAGISYAARQGRHIRMSAIYDALPGKGRKIMMIIIAVVTAVFMFGLCYYSFNYILTQAGRGRVLPSLQIPVWITLVWVPFGFFMTGMQYALTAIKNIIEKDTYLSTAVLEGYDDDEMEV
ncbi:TRAP-type C4-dicarboxylate transport system permease small subunit [Roseovarius halotolerans]|uniref:TRAP transporter small permease protein n=1 Tax=Roseovarius halotolerans TaxID=505353 RepID=A0A1X6Y9V2_9RHOB|nr:TRAP transporter small permease [Roseovarius halotolerans]RKT35047.1 TRAP-type C4-dicarboxylate transport system permease small subunit [Roseovarius halotolerans]SLN14612.1 Tripartite ATP-independent periplasmic transporters, DctQ component [Roseovarius halotolerans]